MKISKFLIFLEISVILMTGECKLSVKDYVFNYNPKFCNFTIEFKNTKEGVLYRSWLDLFVDIPFMKVKSKKCGNFSKKWHFQTYFLLQKTPSWTNGNYEKIAEQTINYCNTKTTTNNFLLKLFWQQIKESDADTGETTCPYKKVSWILNRSSNNSFDFRGFEEAWILPSMTL